MWCGCARVCQHGLPCVKMMMRFLGSAPARCSKSDGRMIYGVSEARTEVVLRRLENQGSYDILMNGFSLQSTTTPKKANKVLSLAFIGVLEGHSRLTRPAWWSLAGQVRSQIGIWDREAWWSGVEKHGGVTPINLGKSRPLP
ncbi:unnamed protein product [Prunus armeniaca]